jgi:spore coat protein E
MANYKEIVTKAVVGKGKKSSKNEYQVQTEENPNTILGCWVINHQLKIVKLN